MGFDLIEIGMAGYGLLSLGIAIVVIAWPTSSERELMRRVRASSSQ